MLKPTFVIFIETATGDVIEAFTWCRDKASGIERARREAPCFGFTPIKIWAEPIESV